ncbi:MAG: hypothetical protein ABW220_04105 [Burkholderiaceae bacterium]
MLDRRTFLIGGGFAATGSALAPLAAVAASDPSAVAFGAALAIAPDDATAATAALRIVGWDPGDVDSVGWVAIDLRWRGNWH